MALTDNTIHYWKLDESSGNAADAVGSATLTNTNISYPAGLINNCANFDTTAKLQGTVSANLGGSFSMNFWLSTDNVTGEHALFESHVASYNNYYTYAALSGNKLMLNMYDGTNNPNITGSTSLSTATWYMVTMIRDTGADTIRIYLNASSDATAVTDSTTSTPVYSNFSLGMRVNDTVGLDGRIDEFGVWSRVLTGTEMTDLYNAGAGLQYPFGVAAGSHNLSLLGVGS